MRVALIHSFYGTAQPSGENKVVEAEFAALKRAGINVTLIAARTDELRESDRLYSIRTAGRVTTGLGRTPMERLGEFAPDLVHVHNLFPNFGRRWVNGLSVPLVVTLHNFRPMCANGFLFREGAVCTACPDGDRWAGFRHGCYRNSRVATLPLAFAGRKGAKSDPLLHRADRLIVLSERARAMYSQQGIPESKLVRWPNFLPCSEAVAPGENISRAGWLFVGRLSAEKGILDLARLWPRTRQLTIVGSGPLKGALEQVSKGNPKIRLAGQLSRSEVLQLMRRSRGLLFPSRWFEGFPLVYVEALSAGLPTLALGPNVVSDLVVKEGTGLVGSVDADVTPLIEQAEEAFPSMSSHCRATFDKTYTEDAFVRRASALYRSLLASDPGSRPSSFTNA